MPLPKADQLYLNRCISGNIPVVIRAITPLKAVKIPLSCLNHWLSLQLGLRGRRNAIYGAIIFERGCVKLTSVFDRRPTCAGGQGASRIAVDID